ncbi:MAG: OmpA family protein [Myxococcaceae bacterium]
MPAGLAMRVRAIPLESPGAKERKEKLKLTHDSAVKMLAPPPKVAEAAADAGAPLAEAPPPSKLSDESLEPEVIAPKKNSTLLVTATLKKKPIEVQVRLVGEEAPAGSTPAKGKEPLKVMVAAGRHAIEVEGKGLLAQTRVIEVAEGAEVGVAFELVRAPKKAGVKDGGGSLTLLKPLRFSPGKALLLPDAKATLAQVVDLVVRAKIKKLKVCVHTDNKGEPAALQKLSQEQAEAVVLSLQEAGLDPSRLEAVGLGDTMPKAPNLTPKGRERNRRVELIAQER